MNSARRAFTLIEMLVVGAIIALLIAILMPSVSRARAQTRRVHCLSNLRSIGQGVLAYAMNDRDENAAPLHRAMIESDSNDWLGRQVAFNAWGGGAATEEFHTPDGGIMLDETWSIKHPEAGWGFGARQRPLTRYLYPKVGNSTEDLKVFQCPADTGVPRLEVFQPVPPENAERPLFTTIGNSYSVNAFQFPMGTRRFSFSVFGQRLSDLTEPSRQMWGGDVLIGPMIMDPSEMRGWHGGLRADNVLFLDGSVRHTRLVLAGNPKWFEDGATRNPPVQSPEAIVRGPGYKIDCYPTPGVAVNGFPLPPDARGWPWRRARVIGDE